MGSGCSGWLTPRASSSSPAKMPEFYALPNHPPRKEPRESPVAKRLGHPEFFQFGAFPRLSTPNEKGQLTWFPIGFRRDFGPTPTRITVRDVNYIVWRHDEHYYGMRDCCSHQGASFALGEVRENTITCPYHGYVFDGINGSLVKIPQYTHVESSAQHIQSYKVVERGDMVYVNIVPVRNDTMKSHLDETAIFVEPEYSDPSKRVIYLQEEFEHNAKLVSVNSLDICHIGFVHSFGNKRQPNPLQYSKIIRIPDTDHHYRIEYQYIAGENSLVNKIYQFDTITVQNEYALPHSTVARVLFGNWSSTIITHALPMSPFRTRLFVKAYRSYWSYDLSGPLRFSWSYPWLFLLNFLGDKITEYTMYSTLQQDKAIVDHIDKSSYESMHGKFSILYDMFSNHYKTQYKRFYESGPSSL